MEFTDLYTVESLQCFNGFHNRGYRVNRSDTDKVNRLIATIRQEREKNIGPVAGDSIEYTCRNGDWFHSAHIEMCIRDRCNTVAIFRSPHTRFYISTSYLQK